MDCATAAPLRQPCLLRRPAAPLVHAAGPFQPARRYLAPRYLISSSPRTAALNLPQDWLEERREDDWKAADKVVQAAETKSHRLSLHLLQAAFRALHVGLRMTALAVRLARSLVADVQRALWWQERQARAQHRAMLAAQAAEREQQLAAAQQRAEQQARFREAGDAQFIALLHTMDNPNIPLEHKWSGIQRHMGEKQEFGKHLSELFTLAGESSKVVQGLAENSAAIWKSELTHQVIAHEEALKRHLYLQMLHAGGFPA